jgi:allantoin racemase
VITSDDDEFIKMHGKLMMHSFPNLEVDSRCIPDQFEGVHDQKTEQLAIPKVIELAKKFPSNVEAIIISCANDPGVKELRGLMKMPVIGAGSATAALASVYGNRVGILGITHEVPRVMVDILSEKFVAYERPPGVEMTTDLGRGSKALFAAANKLVAKGVDTLALGCTGYSTVGFSVSFQERLGIRVIDPVIASGLCAYYLTI